MRKQLCDALISRATRTQMVFITGDLGFMALEPLRDILGERFINAGVAEQNMISVAAALAQQKFEVWVYSIAPFCYARPFEQIRNDVAFHTLPVKLIGNGGGYGYGVMGPSHHAIEDYGVLLTLPNFNVYAPAFDDDIDSVITRAGASSRSSYIRLGVGEQPRDFLVPTYDAWRQITSGEGPVVIVVGSLVGIYIEAFEKMSVETRPNLWVITELPIEQNPLPRNLIYQINNIGKLCVAEEHVRYGGFGSELMLNLADNNITVKKFVHFFARKLHFERYGSQKFMRQKSQLDIESMLAMLECF
jgi:transketolase